jgi:hypothetical protein
MEAFARLSCLKWNACSLKEVTMSATEPEKLPKLAPAVLKTALHDLIRVSADLPFQVQKMLTSCVLQRLSDLEIIVAVF